MQGPQGRRAAASPAGMQTWHIRVGEAGVQAVCEAPKAGVTFDRKAFAADRRIARLRWVRG
jgi:hypothetical protein